MFKGLAKLVQLLIDALAAVCNAVCLLFPPSPFDGIFEGLGEFSDLIAKINYFLPIGEFVAIGEAWLVSITLYYMIALVARWVKAIE